MSDTQKDPTSSPSQPAGNPQSDDDAATLRRLEKEADEMAGKGKETERRYDADHDIFTK
jgi:hypothetical protein